MNYIFHQPVVVYYEKQEHPLLNHVLSKFSDEWNDVFQYSDYTLVYFPLYWESGNWKHPSLSGRFRYYQPEYPLLLIEQLRDVKRTLSTPYFQKVFYQGLGDILGRKDYPEAGFIIVDGRGHVRVKEFARKEEEALKENDPVERLKHELYLFFSRAFRNKPYTNFDFSFRHLAEETSINHVIGHTLDFVSERGPDPEQAFEEESLKVSLEIRKELELKLHGAPGILAADLLARVLEHVMHTDPAMARELEHLLHERLKPEHKKLSRLQIIATNGGYDYKILLPDYDLEIEMPPLPKALYLFFLRHPGGLFLHDLADYRDALFTTYSQLASLTDPGQLNYNIDHLVDMTDNSIHVNCSRIKRAFLEKIAEHIACHYYVNGKRGKVKKISLPPDLIEIDPDLTW